MLTPEIVVVASRDDLDEFFPPDLRAEWDAVLPGTRWVDPDREPVPFDQAEVIVGGWSLSNVPDAAVLDGPLKYVCLFTGSPTGKVTAAQIEAGLLVSNWGTTVAPFVAEGGLAMILAALRRLHVYAADVADNHGWAGIRAEGATLHGKRVAVHGFGGVARALIDLLAPFHVELTVHAPGVPHELIREKGGRPVDSLAELADGAEVFVEVEALRDDNVGCIDADVLWRLPRGAAFVNIGRGALVNEADLARVATELGLRVALDVFATEPLPADSPLRSIPGVLLMPHHAGPPRDARPVLGRLALDNVRRYLAGEPVRHAVDAAALARMT